MSISVNIDKYCKNPKEYESLSSDTKKYYNNICRLRKQVKEKEESQKQKKGAGDITEQVFMGMLLSLFSPAGIQMIAEYEGIKISLEAFGKNILKGLTKLLGKGIYEEAERLAEERAIESINSALLIEALASATERTIAVRVVASIAETIADAFDAFLIIQFIVQLLGMVLDTWDPEGYNQEINKDLLDKLSVSLDNAFMQTALSAMRIGEDEYGNPTFNTTWPVEYYMDKIISDEKVEYYQKKRFQYIVEYLDHLKVNSDGYEICYPNDPNTKLLTEGDFLKLADNVSIVLGDNNTVVGTFFRHYWIMIFMIILFIVLLLLFLK